MWLKTKMWRKKKHPKKLFLIILINVSSSIFMIHKTTYVQTTSNVQKKIIILKNIKTFQKPKDWYMRIHCGVSETLAMCFYHAALLF